MSLIDDKVLKALDKAGDEVLKHSEKWGTGQKLVLFFVCLVAAAALVTGREPLKVVGGVTIAGYGIHFLTFRRRLVESETLVLKDANGKPRIVMNAENGIVFFDENTHQKM